MDVRVGSAPDSWGVWFPENEKQTPWNRFLDEISEAGYEWTELGPYGYLPIDLDTLRRELESRGLRVSGTFVMANLENPDSWPNLEKQVQNTGELLAELGAKYNIDKDWAKLANELRRRSLKKMLNLGENSQPTYNMDDSHRLSLDEILNENGLDAATTEERKNIWWKRVHSLQCWSDFPEALPRLSEKYICASLSFICIDGVVLINPFD